MSEAAGLSPLPPSSGCAPKSPAPAPDIAQGPVSNLGRGCAGARGMGIGLRVRIRIRIMNRNRDHHCLIPRTSAATQSSGASIGHDHRLRWAPKSGAVCNICAFLRLCHMFCSQGRNPCCFGGSRKHSAHKEHTADDGENCLRDCLRERPGRSLSISQSEAAATMKGRHQRPLDRSVGAAELGRRELRECAGEMRIETA